MIADDHEVLRAGLIRLLEHEKDIKIVADLATGEQAYDSYNKLMPEVLLMDISMPGIGGIETLKRIISRDSKAKVVIFSTYKNATYAIQALSNGAIAYVTKSESRQELLKAIRKAAIGEHYLGNEVASAVALQSMIDFNNPANSLSAREFEIFRLIAEGKSHIEIAELLSIGHKTVSNYQTTLKQKLAITTPVDFVRLAIRCGVIDSVV
jgi:two-component system invasion response regulator UvrY